MINQNLKSFEIHFTDLHPLTCMCYHQWNTLLSASCKFGEVKFFFVVVVFVAVVWVVFLNYLSSHCTILPLSIAFVWFNRFSNSCILDWKPSEASTIWFQFVYLRVIWIIHLSIKPNNRSLGASTSSASSETSTQSALARKSRFCDNHFL